MIVITPTGTRPDRTIPFAIAGRLYELRLRWSPRASAWYAELWLPDGTLLAGWTRVVPDWPLWRRRRHPLLPRGRFIPLDVAPDNPPVGLTDLNERIRFLFVTADDIGPVTPDPDELTAVSVVVTEL